MTTLLDDYEVTITMREPQPIAEIVRVDAPREAAAGESVTISVTIRYDARGDYFIYLIDMDTNEILASDREWIGWPGEATIPFTITMPLRDLRLLIELHSEVPPGYPAPIT